MAKIKLKILSVLVWVRMLVDRLVEAAVKVLDPKDGTTVRSVARLVVAGAAYFGLQLDPVQVLEVMGVFEVVLQSLVRSKYGNTPPAD